MRDVKNFSKLFNVNIPVDKYYPLYLSTLYRAGYDKVFEYAKSYEKREEVVGDMHLEKVILLGTLVKQISDTKAYNFFNHNSDLTLEIQYHNFETFNRINEYSTDEHVFISIDLVQANYNLLKKFDKNGELGSSWEDYLAQHNVPELYHESKPFRQHIFGNLNPKRSQKLQAIEMSKLLKRMGMLWGERYVDSFLAFRAHDEVTFAFKKDNVRLEGFKESLINLQNYMTNRFKVTYYQNVLIDGKRSIKTTLDENLNPLKRELRGVEGNLFYMYLKKYILNEPYEDIDLYFTDNGRLAKWVEVI